MKNQWKVLAISALLAVPGALPAQVLITLLFGEKLNSEKVEFGLIGGMNRSYIRDISDAKGLNNLDLGFYFHFLIKNSSYVSTGVLVKSSVGATGMATYPLGDANFDAVYQHGTLTKKIKGFYVPILYQRRVTRQWYVEAGPQLGLIFKPKDIFEVSDHGGDLSYTRGVQDEYKRVDAGVLAGVGYKLKPTTKSMSAGITYYQGMVNVSARPDLTIRNSAVYFFVKLPIGAGAKP